jgi:prolyl 4-hydroxylase
MPMMPTKTKVTFGMQPLRAPVLARPNVAQRLASHPRIQRLGNGRAEIFAAPDFLTPAGCAALCDLIEAQNRPSTIANPNGDTGFRTSQTCDMRADIPVVNDTQNGICGLLGLPRTHAEPLQGQRYAPGQTFKRHSDYFDPNSEGFELYCRKPGHGQRTWTAMAYLDEPETGGHTVFSDLGIDMTPKAGLLLMWNNLMPDGTPNPATMHEATPVGAGIKRIITQWFRERPWR